MSKILIAFILTYIGGIIATIVIDMSWGVYLYQLVYFLNPVSRWWYSHLPNLRYSLIIAVAILAAFIMYRERYSENRLMDLPQTKWLIVIIIMSIAVSFWALWPSKHEKYLVGQLKLIFFLALAYKAIDSPKKFERMIWALLIGCFYIGLISHETGRNYNFRLEGVGMADGEMANDTAAGILTAVPLLLFYIMNGKNWQKVICLIFVAFVFDALILLNSRGAFLGLAVSFVYMAFFLIKPRAVPVNQKVAIIAVMFIGAALFLYLTDTAFWERMDTLRELDERGSGASRIDFWLVTLKIVKNHPFGVGGWGFQYLSPNYIAEEFLTGGIRAVHSSYFQALAEYGYLGPIIFLGFWISNFKMAKKCRNHALSIGNMYLYQQCLAISAGYIGFLTAVAFIDRLHAEMMYWFPLFIACFWNVYVIKNLNESKSNESAAT